MRKYEKVWRTDKAIDDVLESCDEAEMTGTRFRGMSYEDGIKAALEWVLFEPGVLLDDVGPLE